MPEGKRAQRISCLPWRGGEAASKAPGCICLTLCPGHCDGGGTLSPQECQVRPLLAYLSPPLNCSSVCWVKADENLEELRLALHRWDENVASHEGRPQDEEPEGPRWVCSQVACYFIGTSSW